MSIKYFITYKIVLSGKHRVLVIFYRCEELQLIVVGIRNKKCSLCIRPAIRNIAYYFCNPGIFPFSRKCKIRLL